MAALTKALIAADIDRRHRHAAASRKSSFRCSVKGRQQISWRSTWSIRPRTDAPAHRLPVGARRYPLPSPYFIVFGAAIGGGLIWAGWITASSSSGPADAHPAGRNHQQFQLLNLHAAFHRHHLRTAQCACRVSETLLGFVGAAMTKACCRRIICSPRAFRRLFDRAPRAGGVLHHARRGGLQPVRLHPRHLGGRNWHHPDVFLTR